jgi:hypothetical protein
MQPRDVVSAPPCSSNPDWTSAAVILSCDVQCIDQTTDRHLRVMDVEAERAILRRYQFNIFSNPFGAPNE